MNRSIRFSDTNWLLSASEPGFTGDGGGPRRTTFFAAPGFEADYNERVGDWLLLQDAGRVPAHWGPFSTQLGRGLGASTHGLDLPGTGTARDRPSPISVKPIVFDLRQRWLRLQAKPTRAFGLGLGGLVALDWAARFPSDLEAVVAVAPSCRQTSPGRARFRPLGTARWMWAVNHPRLEHRERAWLRSVSRIRSDACLVRWLELAQHAPVQRRTVLRQLRAMAGFGCPRTVSVPTLVLAGGRDSITRPECGARLASRIQAPFETHPNAGHDVPLDAPDWVVERIVDWMASR